MYSTKTNPDVGNAAACFGLIDADRLLCTLIFVFLTRVRNANLSRGDAWYRAAMHSASQGASACVVAGLFKVSKCTTDANLPTF